ncbi:phosphoribosyl-ATP diphosphatase [Pelagibius litoralis]|uniref:Phosphoribosyl-ATP pyrophosphatase n=1 Tax=Pelagibius litoralis TaxID=374515 RepID=A0A967F2K3_9PROT|nr:phosphoribosyl-ATP diphosphatase [Pelagibius litoralis]NIA71740.1 phosphoribosyl-ATP diphosphatase [Pelagibius litoralis]
MKSGSLDGSVLDRLYDVIQSRSGEDPETSHTAKLFDRGMDKIAQKVGEEAVETVIEATRERRDGVIDESADLLYHLLVLWAASDIKPKHVWAALEGRKGISGIVEKASRASG